MFRLNARLRRQSGWWPAFRRNTAASVYTIEAAPNPEVAGSNPAPRELRFAEAAVQPIISCERLSMQYRELVPAQVDPEFHQ